MSNPFRVLIVIAIVVAIVLAAGFAYVVFFQNPGHVSRSLGTSSHVELA